MSVDDAPIVANCGPAVNSDIRFSTGRDSESRPILASLVTAASTVLESLESDFEMRSLLMEQGSVLLA
jgi:hypothetical protein